MKCTECGSCGAYVGAFHIECPNQDCRHYTKSVDVEPEDYEPGDDTERMVFQRMPAESDWDDCEVYHNAVNVGAGI